MSMVRPWPIFLVIALGCGLGGCERAPQTVDEVIERNRQAMAGRATIEAVNSIEVDLHIIDPEAFDGHRAWQWKGEGAAIQEESPKATAALRHGVELPGKLFGLHELQRRGHRVDLTGRERIDGIDYCALRITLNDGYTTTLYVDPKSWLVTRRRDFRPLHVDVDPTPTTIESRFSDFRKVNGVLFAFASSDTDLATGKVSETTTMRSIKVNPQFDPAIFRRL
jgi:hypothetical protein